MKKTNLFSCGIFMFLFLILPSIGLAEETPTQKQVTTKEYSFNGENFEVQTWKDENGEEVYAISTDVKDKIKVAAYVDSLLGENLMTPMGPRLGWSRNLRDVHGSGVIEWSVTGYAEAALTAPVLPNVMRVNNGTIVATYTGAGVADKIILNTKYKFNGLTMSLSYPPSLSSSSNTVTWKSASVTGQWYVNTRSLWAEGASRSSFPSVELTGGADIYKGSNIYRPSAYVKKSWVGK